MNERPAERGATLDVLKIGMHLVQLALLGMLVGKLGTTPADVRGTLLQMADRIDSQVHTATTERQSLRERTEVLDDRLQALADRIDALEDQLRALEVRLQTTENPPRPPDNELPPAPTAPDNSAEPPPPRAHPWTPPPQRHG